MEIIEGSEMKTTKCLIFLGSAILTAMMLLNQPTIVHADKGQARDAKASRGMVASASAEASRIGVEILKQGGNAVDAAVAVGFALGVLEPNASGLGGGGFMLLKMADAKAPVCIDFRERAPLAASPDMYELDKSGEPLNKANTEGPLSIATPGEVAGLLAALEKYGSMSREQVMQPAIDQAEKGISVSQVLADLIMLKYELLQEDPVSAGIYLDEGLPKEAGDTIKNLDLAGTLKLIAKKGRDVFYNGELAAKIIACVKKKGGLLDKSDLAGYEVSFRKPVQGSYRGHRVVSAPPPSSGGAHVIQLLNIMENLSPAECGLNSVESCHFWAEAMRKVYLDRAAYMGDADYIKVPLNGIMSKDYAKKLFKDIDPESIAPDPKAGDPLPYESGSTTHYSVADEHGNMVAVTKTINHFFGSGITVPGTGILLNDQMADFSPKPGGPNSIAPGKKPVSSMSPTLLIKDGKPWASLGTPGGLRIIPSLALVISNLIDQGMDIQSAINAPRLCRYPLGKLNLENRIGRDIQKKLTNMGYELEVRKAYHLFFGGAQGITKNLETGELHGGADPRRDGLAVGF
jgi:gamma-glutamyltranspeptidase/glutathione hydrolase